MRAFDVINQLLQDNTYVTVEQLSKMLQVSATTLRSTIKDINTSKVSGCCIRNYKNHGLRLLIQDEAMFQKYIDALPHSIDYSKQSERIRLLLFYLMQSADYMTIQELCELSDLSRTTVQKDLKEVAKLLQQYGLSLQSKRHYGIRVIGDEKRYRKAFSHFVIDSALYLSPVQDYLDFMKEVSILDDIDFQQKLRALFSAQQMDISELAFQNIITHLKTVIYRLHQNNQIHLDEKNKMQINERYQTLADQIRCLLQTEMGVFLPPEEVLYLASDLSCKAISRCQEDTIRKQYEKKIVAILRSLDEAFSTDFSNDQDLIMNLVFHVEMLVNRVKLDFQLENPLFQDVYLKYNNVFTIAIQFCQALSKCFEIGELSQDEIGYVTLHFAVYFENRKKKQLDTIKRIAIICGTGRSTSTMLKLKLESLFSNASIATISLQEIASIQQEPPDLILSTIPMADSYAGIPVIQIKEFLDDKEIASIQNHVLLRFHQQAIGAPDIYGILSVFKETFFQILDGGSYFEIISQQAQQMQKRHMANENYCTMVLERERKYPTIFMNGVASPHPLRLEAIENCVGITILRHPIEWQGKQVRLIFLINLKAESLFIHQELQRLLLNIIENGDLRERLCGAINFASFVNELKKII